MSPCPHSCPAAAPRMSVIHEQAVGAAMRALNPQVLLSSDPQVQSRALALLPLLREGGDSPG